MIRHWSHARQRGWGYPPKKTACQSGLRFQRYKPLKSVTTAGRPAGRPLILRFLVYISRNSLRASRSLVIIQLWRPNTPIFPNVWKTIQRCCLKLVYEGRLLKSVVRLGWGIRSDRRPGGDSDGTLYPSGDAAADC